MRLGGIFAALTTPFDDRGDLALDRFEQNLIRYSATSLAGCLILGSSGEAIYLDREEKLEILRLAVRVGKAKGKLLLAGTAEESLRGTLDMTARAADLGYHAAVVRTPHYYKKAMTPGALAAYYRAVADQSSIPVLLYNIPPLTGVDLALDTIVDLAAHPNIAGLKESSGNMEKLTRLAALRPEFLVLVGGAATIYPSLCAGAAGAILALAAAAPEACCEVEAAFRRGDHDLALAAQRALLPACKAFEPLAIPGLKAAVDAGGYLGGPPRLPLQPVSPSQRQAISDAVSSLRPACSAA